MRLVADVLERGLWRSPLSRALSLAWRSTAQPRRPVALPEHARVVGVSGPTLGGSCVTPVVLSLCEALSDRGVAVAVAGHGYRARVRGPHVVSPGDTADEVGDEARWLAEALSHRGIHVVVSNDRGAALAAAGTGANLVVADGLLQTRPRRLHGSLLVVEEERPFGAGRCPPGGDLRADAGRLVRAAGAIVAVSRGSSNLVPLEQRVRALCGGTEAPPIFSARGLVTGARTTNGEVLDWITLRSLRAGLVVGIGRPERVLRSLHERGVHPVSVRLLPDHARRSRFHSRARFLRTPRVDVWLTTAKCAPKLDGTYCGAPVAVLAHRVELPEKLVDGVLSFEGLPPAGSW